MAGTLLALAIVASAPALPADVAAYVAGDEALAASDGAAAREALEPLAGSDSPLAGLAAFRLVRAGNSGLTEIEALRLLARAEDGTAVAGPARLLEARLLRRRGEPAQALAALGRIGATGLHPHERAAALELRLWAQRSLGLTHAARGTADRLIEEHPLRSSALAELDDRPAAARIFHVADHLRDGSHREAEAALAGVRRRLGYADRKRHRLHLRAVALMLHLDRRFDPAAVAGLARIARISDDRGLVRRALVAQAEALRSQDLDREAAHLYRHAAAIAVDPDEAARSWLEAGRLSVAAGYPSEALHLYEAAARVAQDEEVAGAAWFAQGLAALDAGDARTAVRVLWDQVDAGASGRARYWLGVACYEAGDLHDAIDLWVAEIEAAPLSYHAHRSLERLLDVAPAVGRAIAGRPGLAAPGGRPPRLADAVKPAGPLLAAALRLALAGRPELAWPLARRVALTGGLPPDAVGFAATLARRVEGAHAAGWLLRIGAPKIRRPEDAGLAAWRLRYPRAHRQAVQAAADDAGLEPSLLFGIVRTESGFDNRARSRAGAVGLAQLLPSTAADVARRQLGERAPAPDDLLDPDLNLRLAAHYLAYLIDRTGGRLAAAIAGYNAGIAHALRWLGDEPEREDRYVAQIPWPGAAAYVTDVLEAYGAYRYLYGPPDDIRRLTR